MSRVQGSGLQFSEEYDYGSVDRDVSRPIGLNTTTEVEASLTSLGGLLGVGTAWMGPDA
jgi:hypothetical protein